MKYMIIGNSAAATGAIESIRSIDQDGEIVLAASEPQRVYARPLISYYLAGKIKRENLFYRNADFYKENRVKTLLGESAVSLDPPGKSVHIKPSGLDLSYDRILIATGGKPVMPACFAGDYSNLFHFHQWQDAEKISARLNPDSHVLIVGGGLIGLKAAESLSRLGIKVRVVEASSHLLNSILDKEAGDLVKDYLSSKGVEIILNNPVVELQGKGFIQGVQLADGTKLSCDMVIMAAGVKPNVGWLGESIAVDEGILVDEYMMSSQPDVYAAGDVVQGYDRFSAVSRVMPLWPFAYRQGRIAGANMAGQATPYQPEPAFNSIPLLGLNIATAGNSAAADEAYEYIKAVSDLGLYKKLVIADNKIRGFVFMGDISRCGIYRFLIDQEIDISSFKHQLLQPDFGMVDLPAEYHLAI